MISKPISIVVITATALLLVSCATPQPAMMEQPPASALSTQTPPEYVIQQGDQLDIKFFYNPELNESVTVRPDGMISLQLVDDIRAAGLRPAELDAEITNQYSRELKKPLVTVIVRSFTSQKVFVGGEVNGQGLIDLRPGMTPLQAVLNAGGFKDTANPTAAIIIRKGVDKRPMPIRVNLKDALFGGEVGQLQPYDVVYVPKSFIAEANLFVNQYIEKLLLFKGFNFGVFYEFDKENTTPPPTRQPGG
jgi:protein involved in polysaccharide export with SLBB domain